MGVRDADELPARPGGGRSFATTHWSLVLAAGHKSSADSDAALAKLCETYWYPLYAYVRRKGCDVHEAQDLTQAFFARLLQKDYLAVADPQRGRFRAFLLSAFKNFLANEFDKQRAQKRGGGRSPVSLDLASGESCYLAGGPGDELTPEQIFDRQWAIALLDRVMKQLEEEMVRAEKGDWFSRLKDFLIGSSEGVTYAAVAESLGSTEGAVKMTTHRMRKRYRELLRSEIARTVEHPSDIDDEIRDLFATFSA